ncbi:MAG: PGF-CTERM sorting domain-containing protein [Halobacteriota archaeon]
MSPRDILTSDTNGTVRLASIGFGIVVLAIGFVVLVGSLSGFATVAELDTTPTDDIQADPPIYQQNATNTSTVSEDPYLETVPERGDPYYEAAAPDGSWISYSNPRDEYRSPYLGDGSGKVCVTLRNENGDVIAGETLPNTTVTIPTGENTAWHPHADPIRVHFPLTENYNRPLDADQFGTSEELPQGDGYLDSHCVEFHGFAEDSTFSYGEADVTGTAADRVEVVGYIQQSHSAWESDVDAIADAEPYENAGGWTYEPDASHGQAVIVLQLTSQDASETPPDSTQTETADPTTTSATESTPTESTPTESTPTEATATDENAQTDSATATSQHRQPQSLGIKSTTLSALLLGVLTVGLGAIVLVMRADR